MTLQTGKGQNGQVQSKQGDATVYEVKKVTERFIKEEGVEAGGESRNLPRVPRRTGAIVPGERKDLKRRRKGEGGGSLLNDSELRRKTPGRSRRRRIRCQRRGRGGGIASFVVLKKCFC